MKNYLLIGYANYEPKDRINYENSLKYFGYNYKIVGDGEKWINFIESKIRRCYEYVKALKSNKPSKIYDIIICTDCFDVLATRAPDMLIRAFDNLMSKRKKRIVIGMENVCGKNCVPITTLQNKPDIYFKSVNGGFYMGYRKDMLKMWKTMLTYGIDDDQRAIGKYVNENPDLFYFDTKSDLSEMYIV